MNHLRLAIVFTVLAIAHSLSACATAPADADSPPAETAQAETQATFTPPDFRELPEGFSPAEILTVSSTPAGAVVLLGALDRGMLLPIFISPGQAAAIDLRINNETFPRPLTHDLMETVIAELGGSLGKVHIDGIEGSAFLATLFLTTDEAVITLDARPSDAIALAAGRNVPIFIAHDVLDHSGLSPDDLQQMEPPRDAPDSPTLDI